MEAKTQEKLIKYLRGRGCYVLKLKPGRGVPIGAPDVLALLEGWWGAFEVKRSANAPYRQLQKETLDKLGNWSTTWVVYPENVDEVIAELEKIL